jgi:integrase
MLDPRASLQVLSLANLENLLDCISEKTQGSQATKQARASTFISFTRYLDRITQGLIRQAKPRTGAMATFRKIRERAATKAITLEHWKKFIKQLREISVRDSLIAKAIFQGSKRVNEVLNAKLDQIDWANNRISYRQSKSSTLIKETVISYSKEFMDELNSYLNNRSHGYIFITRTGNKVTQSHLHRNFSYASIKAELPFNIHPHMLRTSGITLLLGLGFHSDDVMKVSGHSNPSAVLFYDKSAIEENPTTSVKLC